ncbi:MAG: hypothetical protein IKD08_02425 [Alphaproteobacteria bacterium]|nr:hypothetical protein [Alphaproteobacteria bacterium]
MTTNEYNQMLGKIKIFTSGPAKKNASEVSSAITSTSSAFPISKLVSGGISSQFFGIVDRQYVNGNKKGTGIL